MCQYGLGSFYLAFPNQIRINHINKSIVATFLHGKPSLFCGYEISLDIMTIKTPLLHMLYYMN